MLRISILVSNTEVEGPTWEVLGCWEGSRAWRPHAEVAVTTLIIWDEEPRSWRGSESGQAEFQEVVSGGWCSRPWAEARNSP